MRRLASVATMALLLLTACSTGTSRSLPVVAKSKDEVIRQGNAARAFVDHFDASSKNAAGAFSAFAEDATLFDPSNGDLSTNGKADLASSWQGFIDAFPDYRARAVGVFIAADAIAARVAVDGVWPVQPAPPDHPPIDELRLYRLRNGLAITFELSYAYQQMDEFRQGCFEASGCSEKVRALVDGYLKAWTSGDAERIAALYRDDATLTDSMLGVDAKGKRAITTARGRRFGSGEVTCEPLDVYAQTNGTKKDLIGVAIHYRCRLGAGAKILESIAMLELGVRQVNSFAVDPNGLIVRELVLQDATSLAGLASQ